MVGGCGRQPRTTRLKCHSGGGRRAVEAVVDADLDSFLNMTRTSDEGFQRVELPPLQVDVMGVALANDACHQFRLGSGLPGSVVKSLHGPDIACEAIFWVLSSSFQLMLDPGLARRWQELFPEESLEVLERRKRSFQHPPSSRSCLQGQVEAPLQHVGFRGAGHLCIDFQLRQEVGHGLAVAQAREDWNVSRRCSSGSRCRWSLVPPMPAARRYVTSSKVAVIRSMRAGTSAADDDSASDSAPMEPSLFLE